MVMNFVRYDNSESVRLDNPFERSINSKDLYKLTNALVFVLTNNGDQNFVKKKECLNCKKSQSYNISSHIVLGYYETYLL